MIGIPGVPFESQNYHRDFYRRRWTRAPGDFRREQLMGNTRRTLRLGIRRWQEHLTPSVTSTNSRTILRQRARQKKPGWALAHDGDSHFVRRHLGIVVEATGKLIRKHSEVPVVIDTGAGL